jgi:hypothetical protein
MLSTIYKPTTQSREAIVSKYIDCNMMDTVNISNLIEEYTQLTHLHKAWKRFCEEKSIPDKSNFNDFIIIESIKGECPKENNVFQYGRTPFEFIDYCDTPLLQLLSKEILTSLDFKFFNASLLYSCGEDDYDYGYEYLESELIHAEQEYDNYDAEESEEDYLYAIAQSTKIKLVRLCLQRIHDRDVLLPELKKLFDSFYPFGKNCIPKNMYERIWKRAIEYDFDPYAEPEFEDDENEDEDEDEDENINEVELN